MIAPTLSKSARVLQRILADGRDTQPELARALRCDQTTISKWFTKGSIPILALAVALEKRWPQCPAEGWLEPDDE